MRSATPSARGAPNALTSASSASAPARARLALAESQQRLRRTGAGMQIPDVPHLRPPDLGAEHGAAGLEVGERLRRPALGES